jgi:hypothetical protein
MTFSQGAKLPDPEKVFNAMLKGSQWRTIDFYEGDKIAEHALKNLIRASVTLNTAAMKKRSSKTKSEAKEELRIILSVVRILRKTDCSFANIFFARCASLPTWVGKAKRAILMILTRALLRGTSADRRENLCSWEKAPRSKVRSLTSDVARARTHFTLQI